MERLGYGGGNCVILLTDKPIKGIEEGEFLTSNQNIILKLILEGGSYGGNTNKWIFSFLLFLRKFFSYHIKSLFKLSFKFNTNVGSLLAHSFCLFWIFQNWCFAFWASFNVHFETYVVIWSELRFYASIALGCCCTSLCIDHDATETKLT